MVFCIRNNALLYKRERTTQNYVTDKAPRTADMTRDERMAMFNGGSLTLGLVHFVEAEGSHMALLPRGRHVNQYLL